MTRRERARERVADARTVASERVSDAKTAASERMADAKAVASERVSDAKAAAEELIARSKPRLRGVSHEWAFFFSLAAGGALVLTAPSGRAAAPVRGQLLRRRASYLEAAAGSRTVRRSMR